MPNLADRGNEGYHHLAARCLEEYFIHSCDRLKLARIATTFNVLTAITAVRYEVLPIGTKQNVLSLHRYLIACLHAAINA